MEPVQLAVVLAAAVVVASMLSVELSLAVALIELGLGVLVGNVFGIDGDQQWLTFIAGFASIVLTFWPARRSIPTISASVSGSPWRSAWSPSLGRSWSPGWWLGGCSIERSRRR